jgi:hypothetical protein
VNELIALKLKYEINLIDPKLKVCKFNLLLFFPVSYTTLLFDLGKNNVLPLRLVRQGTTIMPTLNKTFNSQHGFSIYMCYDFDLINTKAFI